MHAGKKKGEFPTFYDLDRPGFFPGTGVLFTSVTGDESLRIEAQDNSKTMIEVMATLRKIYGENIPNATGELGVFYHFG